MRIFSFLDCFDGKVHSAFFVHALYFDHICQQGDAAIEPKPAIPSGVDLTPLPVGTHAGVRSTPIRRKGVTAGKYAAQFRLTLELINSGSLQHTIVIPALGVQATLLPAEHRIVHVGSVGAGTYEFFCAIPGHRKAGMIGRLAVSPGR
jgi:hypothetical protein